MSRNNWTSDKEWDLFWIKKSDQPGDDVWTEALRIPRGRGGWWLLRVEDTSRKVTGNKAGEIGRGCVRKTVCQAEEPAVVGEP